MTTQKMTTKEAMHILRKEEYVSPYTQEAIDTVCDALEASERGAVPVGYVDSGGVPYLYTDSPALSLSGTELYAAPPQPAEAKVPEGKAHAMLLALADEMYVAWDSDRNARVGKMLKALSQPDFAPHYRADFAELHAMLAASSVQQVAKVPETDDVCAALDRQYLAGLQAGWGLGSLNDRDGYTAAQNARRNDLSILAASGGNSSGKEV